MYNKILEIIKEKGTKHAGRYIRKDIELWEEITSKTKFIVSNNTMEHINAYLLGMTSYKCKYGNDKKYNDGKFKFCGKSSICQCAKESVSNSVSKTKNKRSKEDIILENKKREETILKKSGGLYSNNGQSQKAKQAHENFYKDKNKVSESIKKQESTCLKKYGVTNYTHTEEYKEKTKTTCLKKYGVENPMQNKDVGNKSRIIRMENFDLEKSLLMYYDSINNKLINDKNLKFITPREEYKGVTKNHYDFQCMTCNTIFNTYINANMKCSICNPTEIKYISKEEQEVFDFISSLDSKCYQSDRSIINPYEIDIIIPDKKIGVEYCGLYWHSEISSGRGKNYHKNKLIKMKEKGYKLITIFSDEWIKNKENIKKHLSYIIGTTNIEKINARSCEVIIVDKKVEKEFFNKNHIQGFTSSSLCYGLLYNDKVVAMMSFGKTRTFMNRKSDDWEIRRFAANSNVRGGASKLISYFKKNNQHVDKIVSDCDLRYSDGNLYEKLGFILEKESRPNYSYVYNYSDRIHRYNFTKHKLVEQGYSPNKTEWEIMQELGYDRIWDCGNRKYVKYL